MNKHEMTMWEWRCPVDTEAGTTRLGEEVSLWLGAGDMVALFGDLGAGKTVLARAIIRALATEPAGDIPSPTFSLVQVYEAGRLPVWHFDLYRIEDSAEIFELGFDEAERDGVALIEWPQHMGDYLPAERLEIHLEDSASGRMARLVGHGGWAARLQRGAALHDFLESCGQGDAPRRWMQGDMSFRRYERLACADEPRILMNAPDLPDGVPGRDGRAYGDVAHLARTMHSFAAIGAWLEAQGLSPPKVFHHDLAHGFLLIEDLGDDVFNTRIAAGAPMDEPYECTIDVLVHLHAREVPAVLTVPGGGTYRLPEYDTDTFLVEVELMLDWYWPLLKGAPVSDERRGELRELWREVLERGFDGPVLVMRDYHSPNLLWLPQRRGLARLGLIDFQDALRGPCAYDLASLLHDARIDVPAGREAALLARYREQRGLDAAQWDAFLFDYARMGAQRASKVLGIFSRYATRAGNHAYLPNIQRVLDGLMRSLSHPELADLRHWYERHLPARAWARR